MTLRITRSADRPEVLKLTGRIRSRDLTEVRAEMRREHKVSAIDIEEVTLVDLDAVRFLASCEQAGVEVVNGSAYIRDWVAREKKFLEEKGE